MSTTITKTGCGCGGGGVSDCGCSGGAGAVCTDASFKRPRFFAGQLLTEDDLQVLTDYVVGKNRLHNRYLFGDGVVCGLSVTCHPCGDGHVVVAPGFALDCCGNDLLLPCAEDLDIKTLLRDLRKRQLAGYDCGDPCDDKDGNRRTYGLYLVYTETLEDPVAPYASTDPCGLQECQPTRVCEGYRFELRCDCEMPARVDILDRIRACIGDFTEAVAAISKAQTAEAQSARMGGALKAIRAEAPVPFDEVSIRTLRDIEPELAGLKEISFKDPDENGNPKVLPSERALRLDVARYQVLTGALTRFRAMPSNDQKAMLEKNEDLSGLIKASTATIADVGPKIEAFAPRVMTSPASRIEAKDTVRLSRKYVLDAPTEGTFETVEARMVALNTPVSYRQVNRMQTDAQLLKDWLMDRLENATTLTRCDLYERVRRVRLDATPGEEAQSDLGTIGAASRGVTELVVILLEYLIDCICLALNPPCHPCEDPAVLLACVTVEDCDVIEICNMSRRFVLSPTAMRYWLPPIGIIGNLMEKFCCDLDLSGAFRRDDPKHVPIPAQQTVGALVSTRPNAMPIASSYAPMVAESAIDEDAAMVLRTFNLAPREASQIIALSSNLALLSLRAAAIESAAVRRRTDALAEAIGLCGRDATASTGIDIEVERQKVIELVNREVSTARESVANEIKGALGKSVDASVLAMQAEVEKKLTSEVTASVNKDLGAKLEKSVSSSVSSTVKSALATALSAAKLKRAVEGNDAFKALKTENKALAAELKKLSDAVDKLGAGGRS